MFVPFIWAAFKMHLLFLASVILYDVDDLRSAVKLGSSRTLVLLSFCPERLTVAAVRALNVTSRGSQDTDPALV